MAKTREAPPGDPNPLDVPFESMAGNQANEPPETVRKPAQMDPSLRLAAKLDRLMREMSPWARQWALEFLIAKYPAPRQDSPACNVPPL